MQMDVKHGLKRRPPVVDREVVAVGIQLRGPGRSAKSGAGVLGSGAALRRDPDREATGRILREALAQLDATPQD
jgi:hypothetical protein